VTTQNQVAHQHTELCSACYNLPWPIEWCCKIIFHFKIFSICSNSEAI